MLKGWLNQATHLLFSYPETLQIFTLFVRFDYGLNRTFNLVETFLLLIFFFFLVFGRGSNKSFVLLYFFSRDKKLNFKKI